LDIAGSYSGQELQLHPTVKHENALIHEDGEQTYYHQPPPEENSKLTIQSFFSQFTSFSHCSAEPLAAPSSPCASSSSSGASPLNDEAYYSSSSSPGPSSTTNNSFCPGDLLRGRKRPVHVEFDKDDGGAVKALRNKRYRFLYAYATSKNVSIFAHSFFAKFQQAKTPKFSRVLSKILSEVRFGYPQASPGK
jgi:hypothetical protein